MKILINGICGHMGKEVEKLCSQGYKNASLVGGVGAFGTGENVYQSFNDVPSNLQIDCVIDFSHHTVTPALLEFATSRKLPLVLCTTGHTEDEIALIYKSAKEIPLFYSANMSLGVALLVELAKKATIAMPEAEIEIVEKHHDRKVDAPSGTALMIAKAITEVRPESVINTGRSGHGKRTPQEIGIHALRMGNVVGEHEVIIATYNQTITLKHEAHNRALFADGAVVASEFLVGKQAGLYDMNSLISEMK